jgi:hypothetical protein
MASLQMSAVEERMMVENAMMARIMMVSRMGGGCSCGQVAAAGVRV